MDTALIIFGMALACAGVLGALVLRSPRWEVEEIVSDDGNDRVIGWSETNAHGANIVSVGSARRYGDPRSHEDIHA